MLGEDTETLKKTLGSLGIVLKPVMYKMDVRPLLRLVLDQFFGPATGFVDMLVDHVPNPIEGAKLKVRLLLVLDIKVTDYFNFWFFRWKVIILDHWIQN